ncbi:MAG: RNA polymerase sigma-70 factor [Flavobacteriales bacterium]|nr:RNA polymerase sigma-70 factor [Flavobacteriales bacterium]
MNTTVLNTLFKAHYDELCRYAFSIVKDQDAAEDVVQQLFIKLWEKRDSIREIDNIRSYLFRSTFNMSLNEQKKMQRMPKSDDEAVRNSSLQSEVQTSSLLTTNELQGRVDSAMMVLPEKCREVFRLSRFEQLSYKEIAEELEISPKTVENQMGKALRIMREELKDYLPLVVLTLILNMPC